MMNVPVTTPTEAEIVVWLKANHPRRNVRVRGPYGSLHGAWEWDSNRGEHSRLNGTDLLSRFGSREQIDAVISTWERVSMEHA